MTLDPATTDPDRYDVVVLGGALAGSSTALLLARLAPEARVLVVERSNAFDFKVGEATVEISGHFLTKELGLDDLLAREHLSKHGLRFWFHDRADRTLAEMAEVGTTHLPGIPSFFLDRSKLDDEVLRRAERSGAEVLRPAKVVDVQLGRPESVVHLESRSDDRAEPVRREVRARWVVDGTGRTGFLARKLDLRERLADHPTSAMWGRWRGALDMDEYFRERGPRGPRGMVASRRMTTNHFCGYGSWTWVIPLPGGETSIGVVYDRRLAFPKTGDGRDKSPRETYLDYLASTPGLRELVDGAELVEGDFTSYRDLPYYARRYAGDGWALVGDAASFLDPFYSPGLDHLAMSASATVRLIAKELAGELDERALAAALEEHNGVFARSYGRWFDGLYRNKYEILGDAELTAAAYRLDTSLYYLGVVRPVLADPEEIASPTLGKPIAMAGLAHSLLRFYNQRLVALARARRARGVYGARNFGWNYLFKGFELGPSLAVGLGSASWIWLRLELGELFAGLRAIGRSLRPRGANRVTPAEIGRTAE